MPGFESRYLQQPFHPYFVKSLERYSVLRYMDWAHTNEQKTVTWQQRLKVQHRTYSSEVPLELMIQLSNTLGSAPWLCVPHTADDDYVRQMARMTLETLRDDVLVYIEHSNEVWNLFFAQGRYAQAEGLRLNLTAVGDKCTTYIGHCPRYRSRNSPLRTCISLSIHTQINEKIKNREKNSVSVHMHTVPSCIHKKTAFDARSFTCGTTVSPLFLFVIVHHRTVLVVILVYPIGECIHVKISPLLANPSGTTRYEASKSSRSGRKCGARNSRRSACVSC
jgi:hypothetical protein